MEVFLEYTIQKDKIITDKITLYIINDEIWIYKLGNYYDKLYLEIKKMNKKQIEEYFKPKHNYNFTEEC